MAGFDFFHILPVEVTAESPAGFPPSPGFPEASSAKALRWVWKIFCPFVSCSATFCHILSKCQCFHTHPFHEDLRSNGYTSLRILPRFVSLWLLFRRALCQRRPRRRVGCSGQAVPCLVLRRFQPAVLVYTRSCWCMLMIIDSIDANVASCWCMLMHADACWCMLIHLNSCNAWSLLTAWSQ